MAPAARLTLPAGTRLPTFNIAPAQFRVQGWDPLLIISQIIALQALHYLTLALVLPVLLNAFASPDLLAYEGGASSVSLILDWREFTGRPTTSISMSRHVPSGLVGLGALSSNMAAKAATETGVTVEDIKLGLVRVLEYDPLRGWAVAFGWAGAAMIDVFYLYHLIRRPTHILDFSLTLIFIHLIITTYYSGSFPTAFFFWFIVGLSTIAQIVVAEQWCVRREMREGFSLETPAIGGPNSAAPNSTNPNTHQSSTPSTRTAPTPDARRGTRPSNGFASMGDDLEMNKVTKAFQSHKKHLSYPAGTISNVVGNLTNGASSNGYERLANKDVDGRS